MPLSDVNICLKIKKEAKDCVMNYNKDFFLGKNYQIAVVNEPAAELLSKKIEHIQQI